MTGHAIAHAHEIPPGSCKIVSVQGREFGIFNLSGDFRAVRNLCPHQGGPLCRGTLSGTTMPSRPCEYVWGREGEILRCPWHGWEFDLRSGAALFDSKLRLRIYAVEVRDGTLFLQL
jgi:nitrite reductase/ring-hydroxylating ferredoxin subunit